MGHGFSLLEAVDFLWGSGEESGVCPGSVGGAAGGRAAAPC